MADFSKEFLIRVRADIEKAVKDMNRLTGEMKSQGKAARVENTQVSGVSRTFTRLASAAGAYVTIQTAFKALRMADEYKIIQTQIRLATKETGDYVKVSEQIFAISQRNGTALQGTVRLFRSVARSGKELGATNDDVLKVTEAIQQLAIMSGAGPVALGNAMTQFGQAMAAGVVRAEEFNSILENTPEVANRIAKGMGLTVGQLRLAVVKGKVLSKDVFRSLLSQAPGIGKEMAEIPESLNRGTRQLENSFQRFLGVLDQASETSSFIGGVLKNWGAWIDLATETVRENVGITGDLNDLQDKRLQLARQIVEVEKELSQLKQQEDKDITTAPRIQIGENRLNQLKKELADVSKQFVELDQKRLGKSKSVAEDKAATDTIPLAAEEQKQLSDALADVNTRLEKQTELFKAQAKEAEAAQQRVGDLSTSFRRAESELGAVETRAADATGLDIQQRVGQARQALAGGDLEGAVAGAEQARDLILAVGKAGTESEFVLRFLLDQAKNIGVQAAQALADQQTGALDAVRNTLLDLQAKAKELQLIKVGFDQEAATLAADALRTNLQAKFTENPLVIPVVLQSAVDQGADQPEPGERIASFARGGIVRGPGTGTSDSILAWLSDQEGVVNARAMRHYGGKRALDQINTLSLPRFAQGGVADLSSRILASSGAAGGGSRPVNLFLNGERFEISASDDVVQRMVRGFSKQALKRGSRA